MKFRVLLTAMFLAASLTGLTDQVHASTASASNAGTSQASRGSGAQPAAESAEAGEDKSLLNSAALSNFSFRSIGPALMSGRIADIAIVQDDPSVWYVAVGSGGVWKTVNSGTTWTPIFDRQTSYSIGSVTIDPSNSNVIWVGTGENVGGRHVGFGDGVYRSTNGGKSWEHLGLEETNHISKIIVHPEDSHTVWVAAQGPLWSSGGERGLYKTTDGGETWRNVLSAGEWTGVTDILIDPRNPDRLYAATWQRHRTVAAYMGGGPESGIHLSEDGGETWTKLSGGLPGGNVGKIGLAISPMNPDVVYAAIELERRTGGVWRSTDRGASWQKRSDTVSGGTGPHYYQELFASPHAFDRIYLVSNYTQVSEDGGQTFRTLNLQYKHVDDHAIAFHPTDPDYILVGSDGGLYESHDNERSWRFIDNLPVTQFYKIAVDDAEPFYFVYGGTQDNNSQGGPSRTDNVHGIRNADWFITLFGDGHQPATEPGNPDIIYSQWQRGNLSRIDRTTGEMVYIQPQGEPGDAPERFNWDAPILVSSHDPKRLYHASQRLWRSDDRGDSWRPLSGDLTRNQDRMLLPIMGRQWSWEAAWDLLAMSVYNSITSIAESPINENLLYVGTDDGILQVTEDGGASWRKIEVGRLPGVPGTAFVNDIKADLFDENTVYVALDNHKYGDYKPYLVKSTDKGATWTSLSGTLPDRHLVWRVVQDHVNKDLMFAGTEFGVFVTFDGGGKWLPMKSGMPPIAVRDLAIQRRETDLVAGTFGRGIYILDDYAPLRDLSEEALEAEALLFTGRRAWWYIEQGPLGRSPGASQGAGYFRAPNPPFGAVFTYYLKDGLKTLEADRLEAERPKVKAWEDTPFPGFDAIDDELQETPPEIWLTVRDSDGTVVRRIKGPTSKGFHRVAWDLRLPSPMPAAREDIQGDGPSGFMAAPGQYTVSLAKRVRGETIVLSEPQPFDVAPLREGALPGASNTETAAFWQDLSGLYRSVMAASGTLNLLDERMERLKNAISRSPTAPAILDDQWAALDADLHEIRTALFGSQAKDQIGELDRETIMGRLGTINLGVTFSTYGPTATHRRLFSEAQADFTAIRSRLTVLHDDAVPALTAGVMDAGGPWMPGAPIPDPR